MNCSQHVVLFGAVICGFVSILVGQYFVFVVHAERSQAGLPKSTSALVVVAIILALAQLLLFWSFAEGSTVRNLYYQGAKWDSFHYQNVVTRGYYSAIPPKRGRTISNVAFFPGYPLLARGVSALLGVHPLTGLLVVAQLSAVLLWIYILLFLRRWQARWEIVVATVCVLLAHPVAFLLVCAYSESLFIAALLGFLYWSIMQHDNRHARALAAIHGFALSATRILGLPLVLYPLVDAAVVRRLQRKAFDAGFLRSLRSPLLLSAIAVMGGLLFFLYCELWFGHWDLYMQTQAVGWGFKADYWKFLDVSLFALSAPEWNPLFGFKGNYFNAMAYPIAVVLAACIAFMEWRGASQAARKNMRERIALYACAAFIVYIGITSRGIVWERNVPMMSMLRFTLPAHVLVLLAVAQRFAATRRKLSPWHLGVIAVACLLSLQLQGMLIWQFIHPDFRNYVP